MDFLLPSDDTMEIMRGEFEKLRRAENARAFALSQDENTPRENNFLTDCEYAGESGVNRAYITAVLLLLYFVKHLGYNMGYGTEIFDTDRSLEQLRRVGSNFGQLNNLG